MYICSFAGSLGLFLVNVGFHPVWQKGCKNWGVSGLWHSVEEGCPVGSLMPSQGLSHSCPKLTLTEIRIFHQKSSDWFPSSGCEPDILGQATRANGTGESLGNRLVPCESKRLGLPLPSARAEFSQSLGSENCLTLKSSKFDTLSTREKRIFLKPGQILSPLQQH